MSRRVGSQAKTRYVTSAILGVGAAAAAVIAAGAAHADNDADAINGWTITPTTGSDVLSLPPSTLSDPSNSLGLGTAPIVGGFTSEPATPLSNIGSNETFTTGPSTIGMPDNLLIEDSWGPGGFEVVEAQTGKDNDLLAFLLPTVGGNQVVDLVNFDVHTAPPLFNPDATGPIDVGGVELASPQAGALLNDLVDAVLTGNSADWNNLVTLLDDLFGIDPSTATDAADPSSLLPDLGI
jgi:hypothetical protein